MHSAEIIVIGGLHEALPVCGYYCVLSWVAQASKLLSNTLQRLISIDSIW